MVDNQVPQRIFNYLVAPISSLVLLLTYLISLENLPIIFPAIAYLTLVLVRLLMLFS